MFDKNSAALKQIAAALERIATALEQGAANPLLSGGVYFPEFSPSPIGVQEDAETLLREMAGDDSDNKQKLLAEDDGNPILRFLKSKNIMIKTVYAENEGDAVLDKIALIMGQHYPNIKKVYHMLKYNVNLGAYFSLDMKDETQATRSYSRQLCEALHQVAFLASFQYHKAPANFLGIQPNRTPQARHFLTGLWLERYIKTEILQNIRKTQNGAELTYVMNPSILLPNGDQTELDFLFAINDDVFWVEAKTGNYQKFVGPYAQMTKLLQMDVNHAFMVLTDVSEETCLILKQTTGMTVVNVENFVHTFKTVIKQLYGSAPHKPNPAREVQSGTA
jgi:hypothetical protein